MSANRRRGLAAGLNASGSTASPLNVADLVSGRDAEGEALRRAPETKVAMERLRGPLENPRGQFGPDPFTQKRLEALAESIREQGLLQPLLVRPVLDGYQVVAGERRWRAAQLAGLQDVPVVVRNLTDDEAYELAVMENMQREDMAMVDIVMALFRLTARRTGVPFSEVPALFTALKNGTAQDEWGLSALLKALFGERGSSFSTVAQQYARYLRLTPTEVQVLRERTLTDAVVLALTALPTDHPARADLLARAQAEQLTARQVTQAAKLALYGQSHHPNLKREVRTLRQALPRLQFLQGAQAEQAAQLIQKLLTLTQSGS